MEVRNIRWAERGLAVAAAEQQDEQLQVLAQLADVIGRVAGELFQGGGEAGGSRASQPLRNCSISASSAASAASSLISGMGFTGFWGGWRRPLSPEAHGCLESEGCAG
jgi:hypothetical protein